MKFFCINAHWVKLTVKKYLREYRCTLFIPCYFSKVYLVLEPWPPILGILCSSTLVENIIVVVWPCVQYTLLQRMVDVALSACKQGAASSQGNESTRKRTMPGNNPEHLNANCGFRPLTCQVQWRAILIHGSHNRWERGVPACTIRGASKWQGRQWLLRCVLEGLKRALRAAINFKSRHTI